MNGGAVAVFGFFVAVAGGEVDAAGDLFVEQDVLHRLGAIGVEADGEFADVAGAGVGVEDFVEVFGVGAGGLDDFAVLEDQAHVGVGDAAVEGGAVVMDDAVDGIAHGGGEDFAVGDVAVAPAGFGGDVLDGKGEVGIARAFEADFVGAVHEVNERVHGAAHFGVVEGADVEEKIFKVFGAHFGHLGHAGGGPA